MTLNSQRKVKRLFTYGMFIVQLGQPLVSSVPAIIMPVLPIDINRLSPIEQDRILSNKYYYPQIAHILKEKVDKIRLTDG